MLVKFSQFGGWNHWTVVGSVAQIGFSQWDASVSTEFGVWMWHTCRISFKKWKNQKNGFKSFIWHFITSSTSFLVAWAHQRVAQGQSLRVHSAADCTPNKKKKRTLLFLFAPFFPSSSSFFYLLTPATPAMAWWVIGSSSRACGEKEWEMEREGERECVCLLCVWCVSAVCLVCEWS